ncbi:epoxide hydrolase 1-like [Zerene cesonia]|uniref:epoxide hydrolase 1-like n=1 Tax=Zerene cesonia TaxID=33412 RepID=UPI0018E56D6D|nr:epoxide hydrolase 1-like [Zerene cesonia]
MSVITLLKRFVVSNVLTLYYSMLVVFWFAVNYLKNPFRNPWTTKVRLEPPTRLSEPKYGVHKYIKANNIKLHYVENGDSSKQLIVFLHGYPEFWYSWRYQLVEFSKDYWCIAVDMRGYCDSERPEEVSAFKLELLVEDIRDLVRQLGREKFILVAHDWGGIVACKYRDLYSETLRGLVVLSSTAIDIWLEAIWTYEEQRRKSWYVFLYRMPIISELLFQQNNLDLLDKAMLVEGKTTIDSQDIECFKFWFSKKHAITPPINYYRANFKYTYKSERFTENLPFLFALGEKDPYIIKEIGDLMETRYTSLEYTRVKDLGHFMQQEDPDIINSLIRSFLNKHNL